MNNNLLVIIPCAGIGNRFSSQIEKQHASLGALSVIETTLSTFMEFDDASKIVVVVKDPERFQEKISIKLDERFSFVSGGNSRSCLLYTSPSPRDNRVSRMPSSA